MDMTADKATDDVRGLVTKLQTLAEDDTSHYPATAKKLAAEAAATLTSLLERAERAEARIKELEQDLALLCGRVGDDDGQPSEQQEWHDFDPDC